MQAFGAVTRRWFESAFETPTEVQRRGWEAIASGEHALLIAPTGSGKTLAAFLWCLDRLSRATPPDVRGVRVLYVSPLKALVYDVERNLRTPLAGIARSAEHAGQPLFVPRVDVRTGDTSPKGRRDQARDPGEILVTTPESLYLLLGSQARENLRSVETLIVDEVHALASTKRGAHLALSLERLCALSGREPQRIGLSATAQPLTRVARFLGGDREVRIVDTSQPPRIDLQIAVPVRDMTRPQESGPAFGDTADEATTVPPPDAPLASGESPLMPPQGDPAEKGMWPLIVPRLHALIQRHRSTIIFVNSRGLCERLTHRLNEVAGVQRVRSHHGSLAHSERSVVEEQLKRGQITAIVATSSLELGIDMGAVDLVLMVESPGSVARGLQRIGRAGHGVGQVSKGRVFPKHRGDLLEATVVGRRMREGALEALSVPENPLDVLAQQIVAMVAVEPLTVAELGRRVRRAANYQNLPQDALVSVLDMLSGRYPSSSFADLRPRLTWDRERDCLEARRGARLISMVNAGTIPDRGTYGVYLGEDGPRVGELDEEMVHETTPGEVFTLGASSWRVERITRDRVLVNPAPGEIGKLPFWRGEGPGRPIELGRAVGAFLRELSQRDPDGVVPWLQQDYGLDALAAQNLADYVADQREATGTVPTDRAITVERFRDELGDYRVCILTPFGGRVHAPWALALEARLSAQSGFDVQSLWSDDGIVLRFADADEIPELELLLPEPEEVRELLVEQLSHSPLFAGLFRENAARALLLPRRRPGSRTPLWMQRRRSSELLAVARQYPSFPIIIETYRACLRDVFDLDALAEVLGGIRSRELRVDHVQTDGASPFARSLVFDYIATYLYDGDAPIAERRAHALSLDRGLLSQLLGDAALRELLDPEVIAEVEAELQALVAERQADDPDTLHDLLRRLGDLSADEVAARCAVPAEPLLERLIEQRRAVRLRVAGAQRYLAIEDVAMYRDALGCPPPPAVPSVFLESVDHPLHGILKRYARTRVPFCAADLAHRYDVPEAQVEAWLEPLVGAGSLVSGALTPGRTGTEHCDADVLRRLKRRTLARLRGELSPVESATAVRFLPAWHGMDRPGEGLTALQEALVQLEGLPLPFSELERAILPARVRDFSPAMLDELGASGWLVWVGAGPLGPSDGKVALFRRERVSWLLEPPSAPDSLSELGQTLLAHLTRRGACFFAELCAACAPAGQDDVLAALHDLMWAGLVTNDTFAPLRTLGAPRSKSARVRSKTFSRASGGRWSLCSELLLETPSPTERAHARAVKLLERHGVVTKEVAQLEDLRGGFSAVYPVLRAMEDAGTVRRGYFVEDLGGAQFAYPGAVDRLRAASQAREDAVRVLSAVDPASPFGWLLPWPSDTTAGSPQEPRPREATKPRRTAGTRVVLVGGEPVLYLGRDGKQMLTLPAARDPHKLELASRALESVARTRRGKFLRVEQIDGQDARSSAWASQLTAINFTATYRGLEIEVR